MTDGLCTLRMVSVQTLLKGKIIVSPLWLIVNLNQSFINTDTLQMKMRKHTYL